MQSGRDFLTGLFTQRSGGVRVVGDNTDRACEASHLEYWYPDYEAVREAFEERETLSVR